MTDEEMVGRHHLIGGHESEEGSGVCEGEGSLTCCSSWCCKESDMTEHLN